MLQTIWVCKNSSLEGTFCLPLLWGSILDLPCSAAVCRRGAQLPTRCVFSAPSFPCFPITSLLLLLSATAHSFFFDLMRIINHLCKSPVSARGVAGFETGESPRLVTRKRDLLDPLQTTWVLWESEREKGESARARVFYLYFGGEWRRMSRVRARLLRYPLSVSGHRLNFTCMNDLQLWPKRAFPWRSGASFPLWDVNVARICQDKEVRHNYPLKNVDDAECAGAFCCSWRGRASHKAKHIWPLFKNHYYYFCRVTCSEVAL